MSQEDHAIFDMTIVGGGLAGILLASRLESSFSGSILLLEAHNSFGGRSRLVDWEKKEWSPAPGILSQKLSQFIGHLFLSKSSSTEAPEFEPARFGLFAQNKMTSFSSLSDKDCVLIKTLGGLAAKKQWLNRWGKIFQSEDEESQKTPLAKLLHLNQKDALASLLKLFSFSLGLSSWLHTSPRALKERAEYQSSLGHSTFMKDLAGSLCVGSAEASSLSLAPGEKVLLARKEEDLWCLKTTKRKIKTRRLVVAQSPWEALTWMDRKDLPQEVLKMALRSKPTSLVLLTKKLVEPFEDLPDQTLVSSESVVVYKSQDSLCFTYALDYESSMSAPEVTKAIKALRRSAIKLSKHFPELNLEEEAIALFPISWGQSAGAKDCDLVEKMTDYPFFRKDLLFCGESYGKSYRPDENIIQSVLACDAYCADQRVKE